MPSEIPHAVGAVLAGGRGSRLGGAKATADLAGRPLISYPLAALTAAGLAPFVVAKAASVRSLSRIAVQAANGAEGPSDVEVVDEPEEPTHPLVGIVAALRHARRPVVVLGCDFPFVPPELLRALAEAPEPLVVPAPGDDAQPLVARWSPELLPDLEAALSREEPLRRTVASLSPRLLTNSDLAPFGDPARVFYNVNTPADLRAAADLL
jgi:molybdenum cofactor guanylyltransferase